MTRYLAATQAVMAITSAMLAALISTLPGWSQTVEPVHPTFKLHAQRVFHAHPTPADMRSLKDFRDSRKVDPSIIKAIGEVRSALPAWTGLHHMPASGKTN
jgi:hypothetical protein